MVIIAFDESKPNEVQTIQTLDQFLAVTIEQKLKSNKDRREAIKEAATTLGVRSVPWLEAEATRLGL